jgi:hypothetical protein
MLLNSLPNFIYGTTRLDEGTPLQQRQEVARLASKHCSWFHISEQYGSALGTLGALIAEEQLPPPRSIFKMEAATTAELVPLCQRHCRALGVTSMDIGQLCLRDRSITELLPGSRGYEDLQNLKRSGLVKSFVIEVFPWTSNLAELALDEGAIGNLAEGFIFYFNPLQRFVSNGLWQKMTRAKVPFIGMRSVCGNNVLALRDQPGAAWKPYLQERATQIAPIFEASGESDWGRFCMRFAHSHPNLRSTVGATASRDNLSAFVNNSVSPEALPSETLQQIHDLQVQWSEKVDALAEAWSM